MRTGYIIECTVVKKTSPNKSYLQVDLKAQTSRKVKTVVKEYGEMVETVHCGQSLLVVGDIFHVSKMNSRTRAKLLKD